jgi:hypothetical protein
MQNKGSKQSNAKTSFANKQAHIPVPVTVKFGITAESWFVITIQGEFNRLAW